MKTSSSPFFSKGSIINKFPILNKEIFKSASGAS